MSSKMEITRICQFCGNEFIARKTVTKYCSQKCASKAYKQRQREAKIENNNKKERLSKPNSTDLSILRDREYFTVSKAALLLGVSRATMYRYLAANIIKSLVIRGKTFVRRQDIDILFENAEPYQTKVRPDKASIDEFYTVQEIKEKYNVKERWVYNVVSKKKIPKVFHRGKNLYSKKYVDKFFMKQETDTNITKWYSMQEIQEKFNMTAIAVYSFVSEKSIPKKKEGRIAYYSKEHVDIAKGIDIPIEEKYYTTEEAMEKYGITRDALYYYVKFHNIPKLKDGRRIRISRPHLDKILEQPKNINHGK